MTTTTKFDPWDWLGVKCGGYYPRIDQQIIGVLELLQTRGYVGHVDDMTDFICTLLCNTDAFQFVDRPSRIWFVGDERFRSLPELIVAWKAWADEVYG